MQSDLDDIRDRVMQPAMLADSPVIPLEMHIENIRKGVERLYNGRDRAKDREIEYVLPHNTDEGSHLLITKL
jgi:hypothetical protein